MGTAYDDVFNWELTGKAPEQQMAAAAVVARMLHLVTLGLQHSCGCSQETGDAEILVACTSFLETITAGFLPRDDADDAQPTTTPPSEPRLRAVRSSTEGA
jgi:hypothetical protein